VPWSGAPDCPVHHRTVSGAPPDNVRCTRGLHAKLVTFGKIQRRSAIIHRTVSGAPRKSGSGTRQSREFAPLKFIGLSGEPAEQQLLRANGHLQAHLMRARSAQKSGTRETVHRTNYSTCPVYTGQPGGPRSQKLQRSDPNGLGDVAGAPNMSGVHRTVRCTIR
jgi:hypothetical protein